MPSFEDLFPSWLAAAYSHTDDDVRLTTWEGDTLNEVSGTSSKAFMIFIMGADEHVMADLPSTKGALGGVRLAFRDFERAQSAAAMLKPSIVYGSKESTSLVYLFWPDAEANSTIADAQADDDDEAYIATDMHLPYRDFGLFTDYEAIVEKKGNFKVYDWADVEAAFFSFSDDDPSGLSADEETVEITTLNDAEVHGSLSDDVLNTKLQIAIAARRDEKVFKVSPEVTFQQLLNSDISKIRVGKKDGKCFVPGVLMDGRRVNPAVTKLYMMGLDVDSGASMEETLAKLRRMGLFFISYTTHSHGTGHLEIKKDRFYKWADDNGYPTEPSTEGVKLFLTDEAKYTADVIASAEYVETVHESTGIQIVVRTRPIDKFRLVFLLDKPYVIAEQKMSQKEAIVQWGDMILGMGAALGIKVDRAARDCSRLFYLPSRDAKATNAKIVINAGKKLDWTTIEKKSIREHNEIADSDPYGQAGAVMGGNVRGRAVSPQKGLDLQQWARETAHGFQISEVFKDHCDDRLREETAPGKFTCECPFDEDHSNAGDPDDKGCFIHDAGSDAQTFAFRCSHDSCSGRDRLDMLQKAMKDGWFTDDVLTDPTYNIAVEEAPEEEEVSEDSGQEETEEPEEEIEGGTATTADIARAMDLAKNATKDMSSDKITVILKMLLKMKMFDRGRIMSLLAQNTKTPIAQLQSFYKQLEAKASPTVADAPYDSEKVSKEIKKRFASAKKETRQVILINDDNEMSVYRHLMKALKNVNFGFEGSEDEPPIEARHQLFRYGTSKVRINVNAEDDVYEMDELTPERLAAVAARELFICKTVDSNTIAEVMVPGNLTGMAVASNELPLLPLDSFASQPFFNSDRKLVTTPGYDSFSKKILRIKREVAEKFSGPDQKLFKADPTWDDILFAKNELAECYGDFPFSDGPEAPKDSDGRSSMAHLIAMMLTPIVRDLIEGSVPLFLVDKPAAGTGATLMIETAMQIATGSKPQTLAMSDNDEEFRKQVTSVFTSGATVAFWDNINIKVTSALIANLATSAVWSDRILGQTMMTEIKNRIVGILAGNNVQLSEENQRRVLPIKLDLHRDPTTAVRTFRIPDLKQHVDEHQFELFGYLLTMVNWWIKQGAPMWEGVPLASFEKFCAVMGGILEANEIGGFLENRTMYSGANNVDRMGWNQFMQELAKKGMLKTRVSINTLIGFYESMQDAPTLSVNGGGRVSQAMESGRMADALQRVVDKVLDQVFTIVDKELEVNVALRRTTKARKVEYYLEVVEDEDMAEAA